MYRYEYWGLGTFTAKINMALEEFFLKKASLDNKASIRFFDFQKDSVVLGYAQATDVIKKVDNSFEITRRPTGGSHVHVGNNILAYCFVVPRDGSFRNYEDMRAYFAEKVANALRELGVENVEVDNKASTIKIDEKVVASHAIIWGVKSALLHGLIIIDPYDVDKVSERVLLKSRKIGGKIYTEYSALKNIPAISKLLTNIAPNAKKEEKNRVLKKIISDLILREVAKKDFVKKIIDEKIIERAKEIYNLKYGKQNWTISRIPPFTEDEVEKIPGEELKGPLKENLGYCLYIQTKDKDFKKMAEPLEE
ncbi:MAG: hypothetical protein QXQ18_02105 [Candidatus Aenigmatarchaeota archaeon]